jgi:hypothetical protein
MAKLVPAISCGKELHDTTRIPKFKDIILNCISGTRKDLIPRKIPIIGILCREKLE